VEIKSCVYVNVEFGIIYKLS